MRDQDDRPDLKGPDEVPRRCWVLWITTALILAGPGVIAADESTRHLPPVYSYRQYDESCTEHAGEATQAVTWNGHSWYLTAPESLVSPASETERVGTPLDVRPLEVFVEQARLRGAGLSKPVAPASTGLPIQLRLVLAVHALTPLGPNTYSLQSIIAVRLCTSEQNGSAGLLYLGPRKGVAIKDWWHRNKSEKWVKGYRDAFTLAVADALDWAAAQK